MKLKDLKNIESAGYQFIHHEMYHGFAYEHNEGMTYGWSDTVQNAVDQLDSYTMGENIVIDVPKYIIESKYIENDKMQLTIHKTSDATESDVTFEVLSSSGFSDTDAVFEKGTDDGVNQVTFSTENSILARNFIRVYASDSDEVMSLLMRPSDMIRTKLVNSDTKNYHVIPSSDWKRSVEIMNEPWKAKTAIGVAKAWFGEKGRIAYESDTDILSNSYQNDIDNVDWLDSKNFVAGVSAYAEYLLLHDFSSSPTQKTVLNYGDLVTDDTAGTVCVSTNATG